MSDDDKNDAAQAVPDPGATRPALSSAAGFGGEDTNIIPELSKAREHPGGITRDDELSRPTTGGVLVTHQQPVSGQALFRGRPATPGDEPDGQTRPSPDPGAATRPQGLAPEQTLDVPSPPSQKALVSAATFPKAGIKPFEVTFILPGYTLLRPLGHGGMAEVWLAERENSAGVPVRCVIKTILPAHADSAGFKERFLDEARITAQLRHPNIVSVVDVGNVKGRLFLAMEWIEGTDAAKLLRVSQQRKVEIPLKHVLYIVRDTLRGLHHAHVAVDHDQQPLHIVHRDISPANILISRQGAVMLADFGVALGTVTQRVEKTGSLAGKLHYFSPELFRRRGATVQSDVFALGVTMYELLRVRPLFPRKLKTPQLVKYILGFDPHMLLEKDLTVPEGLEDIILRSLAPDPRNRYESALEMLEDINDYCYEAGIRLLDAHFARYVERILAPPTVGRKTLLGRARERR